jgi:RNA polymerase sigma factor (sigma-70 family)
MQPLYRIVSAIVIRRPTLIDQFSSFILWNENRFSTWRTDPRLQRNMSKYLAQQPTLTPNQWAIFWQQKWLDSTNKELTLQSQLCREHLYAYLQEPCHQAAFDLWNTYRNYSKEYTLPDYFHFGVLRFDKLLTEFNPQLNSNFSRYATHFLKWRITDTLRKHHKTWGHTSWGLLLHRSKTCVKKALIQYGISGELLENYMLAWECYVEIYKATKTKRDGSIQAPNADNWRKITVAYNSVSSTQTTVDEIRKWILTCGKAISIYISLPPTLNSTNFEGGNNELESLLNKKQLEQLESDYIEIVDFQKIDQKIEIWLENELKHLDIAKARLNPNAKEMLELYYRQEIKQTDVAQKLGINQATVARNLHKLKELLIAKFLEWAPENLNIPVTQNNIEIISRALEAWIQNYYKKTTTIAKEI